MIKGKRRGAVNERYRNGDEGKLSQGDKRKAPEDAGRSRKNGGSGKSRASGNRRKEVYAELPNRS